MNTLDRSNQDNKNDLYYHNRAMVTIPQAHFNRPFSFFSTTDEDVYLLYLPVAEDTDLRAAYCATNAI